MGSYSATITPNELGQQWTQFPSVDVGQPHALPNTGAKDTASNIRPIVDGRTRWCKVVKNASGGTLARGLLVKYGTSAGDWGLNIGGLAGEGDVAHGQVDPDLDAATVANGSYFLMFFKGPSRLIQNSGDGSLAVGNLVVTDASGQVKIQVAAPADTTAAMVQVNSYVGQVETAAAATPAATLTVNLDLKA